MAGSASLLGSNFGATSATTIDVAVTLTAGRTYAIGVVGGDVGSTVSAADTLSNTYTHRGSVVEAAISRRHHGLTCTATTGGSTTITVTYLATTDNRQLYVWEVDGVDGYDAFDTATDTGNNPTTAATATNTAQPAFMLATCMDYQGGTPTVGTIGGASGVDEGTLFVGSGMLIGRGESQSVTSVASQSANFGNSSFSRTTTVLWIFLESAPPTISAQPTDQTANSGATATFSVTATGGSTPYTYQWQDDSGGSFANISGATSSSYTTPSATYSMQSRRYRCVVTGANSLSVTSNSAALLVAFNLSGTGPRVYPIPGGLIGAGTVDGWLRGTDAGGGASSPVGTSTETDTALNLGSARPAGLSAETDSAFALTATSIRAAGLSTETDAALALTPRQIQATGLAAETDAALALAAVQRLAAGLATEADTALALSAVVGTAAGLSTETDTALARAAVQILAVGLAAETDTALALSASAGNQVGAAAETDTALALAGVQVRSAGLAAETDAALALAAVQVRAAGLSTEADTALAMAAVQLRATGVAVETDSALGLSAGGAVPVGLAVETDTAFALDAVSVPQIVIPQTSFSEFSGAVVKTKQEPRQPRVKAPKAARQAKREEAKRLEPVLAPVGMAVEAAEALALQSWVIQRGLVRSAPKPAYPKLMRDSCPHCGAPAAHVHQ